MSSINGSADGVLSQQQINRPFDLNQEVQSESEVNSSSSDDLSELHSSMESMLTKELDGEEMENVVQQPIKNEDMVLQLAITALNPESENPTHRAAPAAPAPPPPPPSPSSLVSTEAPTSRDMGEVCSGEFAPNFVVMGCTRCYIYVMISDADPKCPKCGSYDLLDEFRGNSGLCKRRKN